MEIRMANITIHDANKEYPLALPKGCQWFTILERQRREIRFAMETGHVASKEPPFFVIPAAAQPFRENSLELRNGQLMYFACDNGGRFVQILFGVKGEEDAGK